MNISILTVWHAASWHDILPLYFCSAICLFQSWTVRRDWHIVWPFSKSFFHLSDFSFQTQNVLLFFWQTVSCLFPHHTCKVIFIIKCVWQRGSSWADPTGSRRRGQPEPWRSQEWRLRQAKNRRSSFHRRRTSAWMVCTTELNVDCV